MCGIFGFVTGSDQVLGEILLAAAHRLAYRGYDSVGMATIDAAGSLDLRKDVGSVSDVASRLDFSSMKGRRGIAQLRWATFGAPSKVNARCCFHASLTQLSLLLAGVLLEAAIA